LFRRSALTDSFLKVCKSLDVEERANYWIKEMIKPDGFIHRK